MLICKCTIESNSEKIEKPSYRPESVSLVFGTRCSRNLVISIMSLAEENRKKTDYRIQSNRQCRPSTS